MRGKHSAICSNGSAVGNPHSSSPSLYPHLNEDKLAHGLSNRASHRYINACSYQHQPTSRYGDR